MGEQDRPDGVLEAQSERAARAEQGQESRRDDDRGQHEGHQRKGTQGSPAGEVEAGKDVRPGQRDEDGQRRRQQRLPEGEPRDTQHCRTAHDVEQRERVEGSCGREATSQDGQHREDEEEAQERQRRGGKGERERAATGERPRSRAAAPGAVLSG